MLRHCGELFNESLRRSLVNRLSAAGIQAVAPVLAAFWSRVDTVPYAPCSNWSERHAAYAAGLGTFGLCDGLITPVGKVMRPGSAVASTTIHPTTRSYIATLIVTPIAFSIPRAAAASVSCGARSRLSVNPVTTIRSACAIHCRK